MRDIKTSFKSRVDRLAKFKSLRRPHQSTLPNCFSLLPVSIFCWSGNGRIFTTTTRAVDMSVWQARAVTNHNIFSRPGYFKALSLCPNHCSIFVMIFRLTSSGRFLWSFQIGKRYCQICRQMFVFRRWKIGHYLLMLPYLEANPVRAILSHNDRKPPFRVGCHLYSAHCLS